MKLKCLEQQALLERAISPLAKRFSSTKERAWGLLQNQNGPLDQLLSQRTEPMVRHRVNQWWKKYRTDFPAFGLGMFKRVPSPAKLPDSTYNQLICLVWLTDVLSSEQLVKGMKRRVERDRLVVRKTSLIKRIFGWLRNLVSQK